MTTKKSTKDGTEASPKAPESIQMQTIRLYQPVEFAKRPQTYFANARPDMQNIKMVYDPVSQLISISEPGVDFIFVGLTNLAYMRPVGADVSADESIERK